MSRGKILVVQRHVTVLEKTCRPCRSKILFLCRNLRLCRYLLDLRSWQQIHLELGLLRYLLRDQETKVATASFFFSWPGMAIL